MHLKKNRGEIIFILLLICGGTASAQIEDMVNGGKPQPQKTAAPKKKTSADAPKPASPIVKQQRKRKKKETASTVKIDQRRQVVIKTGATGVEVWLDNKKLGVSDNAGKIFAWLSDGEHQIFARKYNKNLFETAKILVAESKAEFDFSAQVAKSLDEISQAQIAENAAKRNQPQAIDPIALLVNYQDPEKNALISVSEWQTLYDQTRARMKTGVSDKNVEAILSFSQGQIEMANGNAAKAVTLFDSAIVFLPSSPQFYYALGMAQLLANDLQQALTAFQKAVQLNPKYALAYKEIADIYWRQGKMKEAAAAFYQAAQFGAKTPEVHLRIAEIEIKNKNCATATKELEFLQANAANLPIFLSLADCYAEKKRPLSAIETLQKAVEIAPDSALARFRLGLILNKQKEYDKAKAELQKALELDAAGKTINANYAREILGKINRRGAM
jgi:tetratricopeptide (TPR) repeat protein